MSSQHCQSLSEKLPAELLSMIFSELTVVELARIQRTCKRWYNIAQKNSTLWTDATPFFNHVQKWQVSGRKKFLLQLSGLRKLKELSNNRLDGIVLQSDYNDKQYGYGSLRQVIVKTLKEHPPTRMTIMRCTLEERNEDPCFELLAKNKYLKHLSICAEYVSFPSWQLKLACSLESLNLDCPCLSNCSNKEDLMKALMNLKKMKLETDFERPGNLEFLGTIGQNLEDLELIESDIFKIGKLVGDEKTIILFPKLKKLTFNSPSHNANKFYQFDCPQLKSLSLTENLLIPMVEGQGLKLHELLISTDTITHVSISLSDYGKRPSSKAKLERFFALFCHIEEMDVEVWSRVALQILYDTLPKTVSKLKVSLNKHHTFDETAVNRLEQIRDNGGIKKQTKIDDNLLCTFSVPEGPESKSYEVTMFGRKNLHALAYCRRK